MITIKYETTTIYQGDSCEAAAHAAAKWLHSQGKYSNSETTPLRFNDLKGDLHGCVEFLFLTMKSGEELWSRGDTVHNRDRFRKETVEAFRDRCFRYWLDNLGNKGGWAKGRLTIEGLG